MGGAENLKAQQGGTRWWALMSLAAGALMSLVGLGFAMTTLMPSGGPLQTGGGVICPTVPDDQRQRPSDFPQPQVRRSLNGFDDPSRLHFHERDAGSKSSASGNCEI
jgi:hypothetical protein